MNKQHQDVDTDAQSRLWLGGEAAVPRYPQRRRPPFVFNRSILGLMTAAAVGGFLGGMLLGIQCRRPSHVVVERR